MGSTETSVNVGALRVRYIRASCPTCVSDTGSSDLWIVSTACTSPSCLNGTSSIPYPAAQVQSPVAGKNVNVDLLYGDSLTGTHANGPVGMDTCTIAGLSMA